MKKTAVILLSISIAISGFGMGSTVAAKEFNIVDYGAVEGGEKMCTEAIQKAIDACTAAGGGEVIIPEGKFLTATVYMKSNVTLHVKKGATLLGSTKIADYPFVEPTVTRIDDFLTRALIFARGAKNLGIKGEGTLDGQNRLGQSDFLGPGRARKDRPLIVWFDQCEDILVEDVTFKASGFWTQAYTRSRKGVVRGIKVRDNVNDNNDGCDIVDSSDFLIENCDIDCIDDGICLKSYTQAGCKNITARNCRVKSLCNALKTGTDSSGDGFQNIVFENIELYQVGRAAIALEIADGGIMRNVVCKNIKMDVVATPIFIRLTDRQRPMRDKDGNPVVPEKVGVIEDVHISGITALVDDETMPEKEEYTHDEKRLYKRTKPRASSISAIPGYYVRNVTIEDVEITVRGDYDSPKSWDKVNRKSTEDWINHEVPENSKSYPNPTMMGVLPAYGFYIRHAKGVTMKNVKVVAKHEDPRPAFLLDDVHDSVFKNIEKESVSDTPKFVVKPNCTGIHK